MAIETGISGKETGSPPSATQVAESKNIVDAGGSGGGLSPRPAEFAKGEQSTPKGRDISGGDSGSKPVDARVARRRQDPLGRRLRQMYDEVVNEDVPDDFFTFLEQADERLTSSGGDGRPEPDGADKKTRS